MWARDDGRGRRPEEEVGVREDGHQSFWLFCFGLHLAFVNVIACLQILGRIIMIMKGLLHSMKKKAIG
jgi:hypothetical protein